MDRGVIESSLALANALKLNDQELTEMAAMFGLPTDLRESMASLSRPVWFVAHRPHARGRRRAAAGRWGLVGTSWTVG